MASPEELEDLKQYLEEKQAIFDLPDEDFSEYERRVVDEYNR